MERVLDQQGRWRNKVVAFRMSPEEDEVLEAKVKLSGLTKQFVVHFLNRFIPVYDIQAAALRVYVFSGETSPVMVEGTGAPHCGNGSFQSHVLSLWK